MEYLGEHEFGYSSDRLGFPSILGCRAIVYQTKAGIFGYHNAGGNWDCDWVERSREFAEYVRGHAGGGSPGVHLYVTGATRQPQTGYRSAADWPGEAKAFAKALKFKGPRSGYDISTGSDKSVYVEYRRAGNTCILMVCDWDDHHPKNKPPAKDTVGALRADRPDHAARPNRKALIVRVEVDITDLKRVDPVRLD
jgi:hypothetical protein